MSDIHIRRDHDLGLEQAREVAARWADEVERKFQMHCSVLAGEFSDTVEFRRSGVKGTLTVAPDHFELEARLGLLLGVFAKTIEAEILKNLDALLGERKAARKPAAKKGAGKGAAKR
jgi:putative polyhydroxyalkanoate system protein